jgi:hypothetical protein
MTTFFALILVERHRKRKSDFSRTIEKRSKGHGFEVPVLLLENLIGSCNAKLWNVQAF